MNSQGMSILFPFSKLGFLFFIRRNTSNLILPLQKWKKKPLSASGKKAERRVALINLNRNKAIPRNLS
jgi:hypothetical protein